MTHKIRFQIHYPGRASLVMLLGLTFLVVVFLAAAAWQRVAAARAHDRGDRAAAPAGGPVQVAAVASAWQVPAPRGYYLTSSDAFTGSYADDACALGYHMASLWEIADPTHLRYNSNWGYTRFDSGFGPPSATFGWVRTGYDSDSTGEPGYSNCSAWSTSNAGQYGTVVRLPTDWLNASTQDISIWDAGLRECSNGAPVWCAADLVGNGICTEPLILGLGDQVDGYTAFYGNNIPGYSCSAWNESGPETLYAFTLPAGDIYNVTASLSNLSVDLDIFILASTGCGAGLCQAYDSYGDTTASAGPLPPGAYFIAVDGFNGAAGSYTLTLEVFNGAGEKVYLPLVIQGSD